MKHTVRITINDLKQIIREAVQNADQNQNFDDDFDEEDDDFLYTCPTCSMNFVPGVEPENRGPGDYDYVYCPSCNTQIDPTFDDLSEADDADVDLDDDKENEDEEEEGNEPESIDNKQNNMSERESGDSLDAQVDKYLTDYEHEAKSMQREGLDLRSITRRLFEAEDEPNAITAAGGVAQQPGAGEINIENFSNSVVRLIENPENLLEFKNTLLKRATNFLMKAYSSDVVDEFKRVMREEHDLEIGKSSFDIEDEYEAPRAGQAGPGGGA